MAYNIHPDTGARVRRDRETDFGRVTGWIRKYLSSRTVSDWAFFCCGVALGHFLF